MFAHRLWQHSPVSFSHRMSLQPPLSYFTLVLSLLSIPRTISGPIVESHTFLLRFLFPCPFPIYLHLICYFLHVLLYHSIVFCSCRETILFPFNSETFFSTVCRRECFDGSFRGTLTSVSECRKFVPEKKAIDGSIQPGASCPLRK